MITAVAAAVLAKKFAKLQRSFQEVHDQLKRNCDSLDKICSQMERMNEMLESTSDDADDVNDQLSTRDYDDFCAVFDALLNGVRAAHQFLLQSHAHP